MFYHIKIHYQITSNEINCTQRQCERYTSIWMYSKFDFVSNAFSIGLGRPRGYIVVLYCQPENRLRYQDFLTSSKFAIHTILLACLSLFPPTPDQCESTKSNHDSQSDSASNYNEGHVARNEAWSIIVWVLSYSGSC